MQLCFPLGFVLDSTFFEVHFHYMDMPRNICAIFHSEEARECKTQLYDENKAEHEV